MGGGSFFIMLDNFYELGKSNTFIIKFMEKYLDAHSKNGRRNYTLQDSPRERGVLHK